MRGRSAISTVVLLLVLPLAVLPGGATASGRVTKQDRTATRKYLEAKLAYEQAKLANAAASKSAVEALAQQIGRECPDVAAGAPKRASLSASADSTPAPSPRREGELNRESRQLAEMKIELYAALDQVRAGPYRKAELSFVHTAASLRWSDRSVTHFVHVVTFAVDEELASASLRVCTDLRYWANSGYTSIPAAARVVVRHAETVADNFLLFTFLHPRAFLRSPLLQPFANFEDARDRALVRKTERIATEAKADIGLNTIMDQLQRTLGLADEEESTAKHEPPPKAPEQAPKAPPPSTRSIVIGHGRTLAGGRYTIKVEHGLHLAEGGRGRCVEIEINETIGGPGGQSSSGTTKCLSRSPREAPKVTCEEGLLTIEAQTLPSARRVLLTLSNGRQATSPVAIVPPRLGGPIGYYHEAVWGPSPIPVTLSELGARGRLLRSVDLPSRTGCKRPPQPFEDIHIVATGTVPWGGPHFVIIAHGGEPHAFVADVASLLVIVGEQSVVAKAPTRQRHRIYQWRLATGCQPHEYAIVYGLLRDRRDRVLARTARGLVTLPRVPMSASLRAPGVLSYAALPTVPGEIVVRSPTGKTLMKADLASRAKRARELCEGEAEPPA